MSAKSKLTKARSDVSIAIASPKPESLEKFLLNHGINYTSNASDKVLRHGINLEDTKIYISCDENSVSKWFRKDTQKLMNFDLLMREEESLTCLHSMAAEICLPLAAKQVEIFLKKFYDAGAIGIKSRTKLTELTSPIVGNNVLKTLESVVLPNYPFVDSFHFLLESNGPLVALVIAIMKYFGNFLVEVEKTSSYTQSSPTVCAVNDDADVFSTVERILDLILSTPKVFLKIDIFIHQSLRETFDSLFAQQATKRLYDKRLYNLADELRHQSPTPIFTIPKVVDKMWIKTYYFRKVDELKLILDKYEKIARFTFWSENISMGIGFCRSLTNCKYLSVNTLPEVDFNVERPTLLSYTKFTIGSAVFRYEKVKEINPLTTQEMKTQEEFHRIPFRQRLFRLSCELKPNSLKLIQRRFLKSNTFEERNDMILMRKVHLLGLIVFDIQNNLNPSQEEIFLKIVARLMLHGNYLVFMVYKDAINIQLTKKLLNIQESCKIPLIKYTTEKFYKSVGWIKDGDKICGMVADPETFLSICEIWDDFPHFQSILTIPTIDGLKYAQNTGSTSL